MQAKERVNRKMKFLVFVDYTVLRKPRCHMSTEASSLPLSLVYQKPPMATPNVEVSCLHKFFHIPKIAETLKWFMIHLGNFS